VTLDDVTRRVLDALVRVAPEIDPANVPPDAALRDEYDIDSMDFLNFVIGLHETFGIDIPEADYPALATLAGAVRYVREHAAPAAGGRTASRAPSPGSAEATAPRRGTTPSRSPRGRRSPSRRPRNTVATPRASRRRSSSSRRWRPASSSPTSRSRSGPA
jgi:acyl carrier protein